MRKGVIAFVQYSNYLILIPRGTLGLIYYYVNEQIGSYTSCDHHYAARGGPVAATKRSECHRGEKVKSNASLEKMRE